MELGVRRVIQMYGTTWYSSPEFARMRALPCAHLFNARKLVTGYSPWQFPCIEFFCGLSIAGQSGISFWSATIGTTIKCPQDKRLAAAFQALISYLSHVSLVGMGWKYREYFRWSRRPTVASGGPRRIEDRPTRGESLAEDCPAGLDTLQLLEYSWRIQKYCIMAIGVKPIGVTIMVTCRNDHKQQ